MNTAADSQRRRLKLAAFVIALVVTVAAGLLVRGYLTGEQWVATVAATVRGVVTPVLGPTP